MIISFFEEFPTKENLNKLKLITWPSKLYLAAKSVVEFEELKTKIRNKNIVEVIYWPILQKSEGYWISPFSKQNALRRIFQELNGKSIPVMLDLELPTTQNPLLYLTQSLHFHYNKNSIRHFIDHHPGKIYLAEYFMGPGGRKLFKYVGLHYTASKPNIIPMMYHSLHPLSPQNIQKEFSVAKKIFGKKCIPGFGTIAPGVMVIEPILSPTLLHQDLALAAEAGFEEVIIFRLGGLNKEYVDIIKKI